MGQQFWRKCSVCKKEIAFNQTYQVCSVSSCRKFTYCSVTCWEVHVPVMNHKSAWAEEEKAPTSHPTQTISPNAPRRRKVISSSSSTTKQQQLPQDILVVVSKLKAYVKAKNDLNTSTDVMEKLSSLIRYMCDQAAEHAMIDGRKTLMARDFK